jgi:hypothetical protein
MPAESRFLMIGSITVMDHCTALHSITDTPAGIRTRTYYRSVIGWIESLMESCWAVVLAVTRSSTHIRVDSLSFPSIYSFCVASASNLVMGPRLVILAKSTPQAPHIEGSPQSVVPRRYAHWTGPTSHLGN